MTETAFRTPEPSVQWHVLGGNNASRIGMNSGLCVYRETNSLGQAQTKRFLFDAGIMSADPRRPEHEVLRASDTVMVDYDRYLFKAADPAHVPSEPLDAIFLTHSHSDHMGALPYLALMGYKLPVIYATPYTAKRLEQEFSNLGMGPAEWPEIKMIAPGMAVQEGGVKVSPFWVSHSTPHSVGYFIETPAGNILNPGDFKLDQSVVWGPAFDEDQFKRVIGDKTVDLMLLDSTGADRDITPTTEHDMRETLRDIMDSHPRKRFIIAVMSGFEENVASIAKVTAEHNRTLWVCGWSHEQSLAALKATGLSLSDSIGTPVDVRVLTQGKAARDLDDMPAGHSVVLVTGAQGSPNAALTRAIEGSHPTLHLDPQKDVVLFCAPVIPGQEAQHARLMASLKNAGIKCLTRADAPLYAQAHARLPELLDMLKMAKPATILPVHGDKRLRAAAQDAYTKAGYHALTEHNGAIVDVKKDGKTQKAQTEFAHDYVGLKTLQGMSWSDRHYLVTRTRDAGEGSVPSPADPRHKKPKIYEIRPKS